MDAEQNRCKLTRVDDVEANDAVWRDELSAAVCGAEQASSMLRRISGELPHAEGESWSRFASDVAAATLRFDVQLGTAAARLRAETATSGPEAPGDQQSETHDPFAAIRCRVSEVLDDLGHLVSHRDDRA